MPIMFGILAVLVLALLATALFTIWALPFVGAAAIAAVAYLLVARRKDPSVGAIERGRGTEPTGRPRQSRAGAETSNERVGQA